MFATSSQRERRGNRFTIVAVAEGIKLPPKLRQIAHGGPVGNLVGEAVSLIANKAVRVSVLGHIQRGDRRSASSTTPIRKAESRSARSSMPSVTNSARTILGPHYHGVRYRASGYRQIIEVHLLFPHATAVGEAHRRATALEEQLPVESPRK